MLKYLGTEIEYINPQFTRQTGYTWQDIVGKTPSVIKSGKTSKTVYQELWKTITTGDTWQGEFHSQKKNGETYWEQSTIAPIFDANGNASHYIGINIDISERKSSEQALLEAMNQAQQANRSKNHFLANMSHEIRTPMNAIIGMTHLALQTSMTTKQQDYLNNIQISAQSLLTIINDILDFSQIEAGKLSIESVPFQLDDVLDKLNYMIQDKAKQKNLKFVCIRSSKAPATLIGDATRLEQILINLADNAIKFTTQGKVSVSVQLMNYREHHVQLRFRVKDTGIGIDLEKSSLLFSAFSQADTSTTRKYGGTGLGLSICKHLITMMDGQFDITSKLGEGSTFSFSAWFGYQHLKTKSKKPSIAKQITNANVLLVEDNRINQQVAVELLQRNGLRVQVAVNGQAALDLLEQDTFDIVLMDIQMPEMDGITATKIIRQDPRFEKLPIIAMTANTMEGDREESLAAGMNDHIAKPINIERLFTALHQWIPAQPSENSLPPIQGIDIKAGLKVVDQNRTLYEQLLQTFYQDYQGFVATLYQALSQNDLNQICHLSHSLKGVAGTLGAKALYQVALTLETAAKQQKTSDLKPLVTQLEQTLTPILNELAHNHASIIQESKSETPTQALDLETLTPLFIDLSALLEIGHTKAATVLAEISPLLDSNANSHLETIAEQIESYDYGDALASLTQLAKLLCIPIPQK